MNFQEDIMTKAFYAKELPEYFPVHKTIRQHYVSQKYTLGAFNFWVSLELQSKIADVVDVWQATAEPFVIACHSFLLDYITEPGVSWEN